MRLALFAHIIAIIATAHLLSGCVTLLAAGAGAGLGYVAAEEIDKPATSTRRKAFRWEDLDPTEKEIRAEAETKQRQLQQKEVNIVSSLNARLLGGDLTKVLAVQPVMQDGIVTLYGTVPSQKVADRAIAITKQTPGVRQVVSKLIVVEMRLEPVQHDERPKQKMKIPPPSIPKNQPRPMPTKQPKNPVPPRIKVNPDGTLIRRPEENPSKFTPPDYKPGTSEQIDEDPFG